MAKIVTSVKGMNDILPKQMNAWQRVEQALKDVARQFSFQEIRFPIVEKTELFKRSIGDLTDIVQKEMYSFEDRHNGDLLTLRPEGTAPCVRACLQNNMLYNQIQRLWYMGPLFRHERPQKGRYRQFHQFGVEAFGYDSVGVELELLAMNQKFWQALGLTEVSVLKLNTIGELEERQQYQIKLYEYLSRYKQDLDEESLTRLDKNPLRILDSKNEKVQTILADAPTLAQHLSENSLQRFQQLKEGLDKLGINYVYTPTLVRGLDYYSHTVFEWVTDSLGAQGTISAGGRYDSLVEQLGGKPTPAAGFAIGIERLTLLLEELDLLSEQSDCDIYVVIDKTVKMSDALVVVENLRQAYPNKQVMVDMAQSSIKSQLKRAHSHGASYAVLFTSEFNEQALVSLKAMKHQGEPQLLTKSQLIEQLKLSLD